MKKYSLCLSLCLLFSFPIVAKLPEQITKGELKYNKCNQHTIKYALFIKVAEVGYYLKDCSSKIGLLEQKDKLIRFKYHMDVKADFFKDSAEEYYLKNQKEPIADEIFSELKRFNQSYVNINDNEHFDLQQIDGKEILLFKNLKLLGQSSNPELSRDYFNIWFGEYPVIKPLRKKFL